MKRLTLAKLVFNVCVNVCFVLYLCGDGFCGFVLRKDLHKYILREREMKSFEICICI